MEEKDMVKFEEIDDVEDIEETEEEFAETCTEIEKQLKNGKLAKAS